MTTMAMMMITGDGGRGGGGRRKVKLIKLTMILGQKNSLHMAFTGWTTGQRHWSHYWQHSDDTARPTEWKGGENFPGKCVSKVTGISVLPLPSFSKRVLVVIVSYGKKFSFNHKLNSFSCERFVPALIKRLRATRKWVIDTAVVVTLP